MSTPDYRLTDSEKKTLKTIQKKLNFNNLEADMVILKGFSTEYRNIVFKIFPFLYTAYQNNITDKAKLKISHKEELEKQKAQLLQEQVRLLGAQQKQHQDTLVKQQQQQLYHHESVLKDERKSYDTKFSNILGKLDTITEEVKKTQKEPEFTIDVHNLETGEMEQQSITKKKYLEKFTIQLATAKEEVTIETKKRKSAEDERDESTKRAKNAEDKEKASKQQLENYQQQMQQKQTEINSLKASLQQFKSLAKNS